MALDVSGMEDEEKARKAKKPKKDVTPEQMVEWLLTPDEEKKK